LQPPTTSHLSFGMYQIQSMELKKNKVPDRTGMTKLMIRALREQGFSYRKIGKRLGLSGARVGQICADMQSR
jgi:hypothetical protein